MHQRWARLWAWAWAVACLVWGLAPAHAAPRGPQLGLYTWNLEWLLTPAADRELRAACRPRQPASDERALPCTPGRAEVPRRQADDLDALAHTARRLRTEFQADVVALQEVDGPQAARQVFREGWVVDCFTRRAHPQKLGFALREGLPYRCQGDLSALDIDGRSRSGADILLWPDTPQAVRLLAVHLKSGCFSGRLDRDFTPCIDLQAQVVAVERWIDARVREGVAFAVLGDFNRRLAQDARQDAGPDETAPQAMFKAWSDDRPRGAVLHRASEGASYVPCSEDDRYQAYIDDVLISQSLRAQARGLAFQRVAYALRDRGKVLSDHCPVGLRLDGLR